MILDNNWQCKGNAFKGFIDGSADSSDSNFNSNSGCMLSPEFEIENKYLLFGFFCTAWRSDTGLKMYIDGELQFSLTDCILWSPMEKYALDLSGFIGKKGQILIADGGVFESVVIKEMSLTDEIKDDVRVLQPRKDSHMLDYSLYIGEEKYINIPIEKRANAEFCNFSFGDRTAFSLNLKLAKGDIVDFIASIPVEEFQGKTVRIFSEEVFIPKDKYDAFCEKITVSKEPYGCEQYYLETARPKLHFTTPYGGNGDMIGFYFYKDKYHIGYLFDSGYNTWNENASWAFSESDDLFSWKNQRMIVRKGCGNKRSSGCGFVDERNATNLKTGEDDPILLFYGFEDQLGQRYQNFTQDSDVKERQDMLTGISVKYSTDGGKTFQEYENNPLFLSKAAGGHDPEVFYYEAEDKYVMVMHDGNRGVWGFEFYESKDLLTWTYMSCVPNMWETPNIYELPLDGDETNTYWILQQCDHDYVIGTFDGHQFTPVTELQKTYKNAFAMRTFYDAKNKRRIQMGAMSHTYQGDGTYHGYGGGTIPSEVTLKNTENGMKLAYQPVREIDAFVLEEKNFAQITTTEFNEKKLCGGLLDIQIESKESFALKVGDTTIFEYEATSNSYRIGSEEGNVGNVSCNVRLLLDESVASYYVDGGLQAGNVYFPHYRINTEKQLSFAGTSKLERIRVRYLRSPYVNNEYLHGEVTQL